MAPGSKPSLLGRIVRLSLIALVSVVLVNEAYQFAAAWTRIYSATQAARTSLGSVIVANPNDRGAAARQAQAACIQSGVSLVAYGHVVHGVVPGQQIDARLDMESVVKGVLLTPMVEALMQDGSLSAWKTHMPIVSYTYLERFATLQ